MSRVLEAYCLERNHWPDEIIVYTTDESWRDLYEQGVIFDGQGEPTNRWGDGTAGVPLNVAQEAISNMGLAYCLEHQAELEWRYRK